MYICLQKLHNQGGFGKRKYGGKTTSLTVNITMLCTPSTGLLHPLQKCDGFGHQTTLMVPGTDWEKLDLSSLAPCQSRSSKLSNAAGDGALWSGWAVPSDRLLLGMSCCAWARSRNRWFVKLAKIGADENGCDTPELQLTTVCPCWFPRTPFCVFKIQKNEIRMKIKIQMN